MRLTGEEISRWFVPGAISVAVHVAIIACCLGTRGCGEASPAPGAAGPAAAEASAPPAEAPAAARHEERAPDAGDRPRRAAAPDGAEAGAKRRDRAADAGFDVYQVKRGDNFTRIARAHGCAPEELAQLNGKDLKAFDSIQVGQKIKVPRRGE